MRVVVAGATGLVGSRTVVRLRDHGVEVVPLSHPEHSGAATERDLARALRGADIVVDVTDAPSPAEPVSLQFFRTSTTALLAAAERAGVEHHVVLSFVGAERLLSGWFRAKLLLEDQVRRSPVPHSIVRAALSFECVEAMARQDAHQDGEVRVAPALVRPASADDVAAAVAHVAVGLPLFGTLEVAGPEEFGLDELTAELLAATGDARHVVADEHAWFFGAELRRRSLLPAAHAHVARTTFREWLAQR
ncbi:NAD(P)H-binding protein [Actinacidiphila glaucinigra]|uniref:SDR family oxidoreductase n=1 Tax=Actinacidiphila glaucinigra TaxID=235986 RepID=UPI0033B435BB